MSHPTHARDVPDGLHPDAVEREHDQDTEETGKFDGNGGHALNPGADATDTHGHKQGPDQDD
jgi:hypothetical protein